MTYARAEVGKSSNGAMGRICEIKAAMVTLTTKQKGEMV